MASNPPGPCCTTGTLHKGEPTGKSTKIGEAKIEAYLATAAGDKAHKDAAVLLLPDVVGIWNNSQLLADSFASNGYTCLIPDLFNGDALALNRPASLDVMAWIAKGSDGKNPHTTEYVDPIVVAGIRELKRMGYSKIAAVGYCFGAKYVIRHYKDGINCGYLAHPSFVEDEELEAITGPLSISAAETDSIFPADKRHRSETILAKTKQPWQINLFSGVSHGFAVRGDPSVRVERFAKEQAFCQAICWFDEYLLNP